MRFQDAKASSCLKGMHNSPFASTWYLTFILDLISGKGMAALKDYPKHRHPTKQQVTDLLPAVRRREYLNDSPFLSLTILAKRNPDKIYQ